MSNLLTIFIAIIALVGQGNMTAEDLDVARYIEAYEVGWDENVQATQGVQRTIYVDTCSTNNNQPSVNVNAPSNVQPIKNSKISLWADINLANSGRSGSTDYTKFRDFMNWENKQDFSHSYFLGDAIDDHHKKWQITAFNEINNQRNKQTTYIMGNHEGSAFPQWELNDMKTDIRGNTCITMFNTYSEEKVHGSWTEEQINYLEQELDKNVNVCDYFLILSHHGIYDRYAENTEITNMLSSQKNNYDKIINFRGHNEIYEQRIKNGVEYYIVPGIRGSNSVSLTNYLSMSFDVDTGDVNLCHLRTGCKVV